MPTDVIMPQMGESIFEGTITKWLKKIGDAVDKDEPLFEITTDKVDAEIPAPEAGVLAEIRVLEGATVEINTVVAIIGETGSSTAPVQESAAPSATNLLQEAAPPQVVQKSAAPSATNLLQEAAPPQVVQKSAAPSATDLLQKPAPPQVAGQVARQVVSPLARRMAKEHGLDLGRIAGSGPEGRIGKVDVLRAINEGSSANLIQEAAPPQVAQVAQVPTELVPLTRMRSIIAERMIESMRISPHVHTVYKVDMTRIARLRDRQKAAFAQRHGIKLTFMPFIAAAVIEAIRRFPVVNASLESSAQGPAIRYHQNVNLGIAVALDWGLIVPVVRQAEQRSFADLAGRIGDLAERARTKKLAPDEVGGSTITLTNSGIFGDEFSTPIINQPESAILCISGLKKEPVVLTDGEGNDTIAIRSMQHFTLGFDHRLIDGADACRFMAELKRVLESWNREIV